MKMIGFGLLALLGVAVFASSATAQTCTTPTALTSGLNNGLAGNSCAPPGGTGDNSVANACDGSQITGAAAVFSWTVNGGSPTGNITVTPNGWDTAIFIGHGADCATANGGFCDSKADTAGNVAETLAVPTAANTYFLLISSFSAGVACGPYTISTGTLPVKLQGFSVD